MRGERNDGNVTAEAQRAQRRAEKDRNTGERQRPTPWALLLSAAPPSPLRLCVVVSVVVLSVLALGSSGSSAAAAEDGVGKKTALAASVATGFPVAAQRVYDVDRDGKADLVAVGEHGEVRVWRHDAASGAVGSKPVGSLVLRYPDRTLLAVADLLGGGAAPQLVEMTKDGVFLHRVEPDGSWSRAQDCVAPRTKLPIRVGRPTFAEIARDVNGDGRADLVLPRGEECELWLNGGADAQTGLPTFTKAASIRVRLTRESQSKGEALSDVLEESFRIPNLSIVDVNGDGRRDLYVENGKQRAWHLQREDGTFPASPDVTLDLNIFRDTTPEASVQLGKTLAGGDDQRMETRDLDGDSIPDYVIAHRRKVWVFHGTKAGPQFTEPSDILRVGDDVTMLMLLNLDDDAYPDLLLARVQVPTIATLLRGLVSEWDLEIASLGYASAGGKKFETTPRWKGAIDVRLPALLGLIKNPEPLIRKFEDVAKKFRRTIAGDFDGDGREDVALVADDGARVDVYVSKLDPAKPPKGAEKAVGDVLFGEEKQVWDIDTILNWLGDVAERQAARRTGGAAPVAAWKFRDGAEWRRTGVECGDVDGDGRAEIVVAYDHDGAEGVFDVIKVQ